MPKGGYITTLTTTKCVSDLLLCVMLNHRPTLRPTYRPTGRCVNATTTASSIFKNDNSNKQLLNNSCSPFCGFIHSFILEIITWNLYNIRKQAERTNAASLGWPTISKESMKNNVNKCKEPAQTIVYISHTHPLTIVLHTHAVIHMLCAIVNKHLWDFHVPVHTCALENVNININNCKEHEQELLWPALYYMRRVQLEWV